MFMLLTTLNIQSWKVENDRMKEKFLNLLGKIGKDARSSKTTSRVSKINEISFIFEFLRHYKLGQLSVRRAIKHKS